MSAAATNDASTVGAGASTSVYAIKVRARVPSCRPVMFPSLPEMMLICSKVGASMLRGADTSRMRAPAVFMRSCDVCCTHTLTSVTSRATASPACPKRSVSLCTIGVFPLNCTPASRVVKLNVRVIAGKVTHARCKRRRRRRMNKLSGPSMSV